MARFKITGLEKDLEKLLDLIVEIPRRNLRSAIKKAYDNLVERSPVFTGYYKTNHRIIIRDSKGRFKTQGTAKRVPVNKPGSSVALAFINNLSTARAEEMEKLDKVEIGDLITLTTSVPYAFAIEQKHMIYANAETQFRVTR